MEIDDIVSLAWSLKAQVHKPALVHLCNMAQSAPDGIGVEIGVYRGGSMVAWGLAREGRGEIIGVDDWSYTEPSSLREKALHTLETAHVDALLLDMTSREAAYRVAPPLAFVFIDANHTLEAVREDIEMWTPKIMRGGVVAFHDYGRNRADIQVKQAVDEWHRKAQWQCLGGTLTVIGYRRP